MEMLPGPDRRSMVWPGVPGGAPEGSAPESATWASLTRPPPYTPLPTFGLPPHPCRQPPVTTFTSRDVHNPCRQNVTTERSPFEYTITERSPFQKPARMRSDAGAGIRCAQSRLAVARLRARIVAPSTDGNSRPSPAATTCAQTGSASAACCSGSQLITALRLRAG